MATRKKERGRTAFRWVDQVVWYGVVWCGVVLLLTLTCFKWTVNVLSNAKVGSTPLVCTDSGGQANIAKHLDCVLAR